MSHISGYDFLSGQDEFRRGQDDFFQTANQPISVRHLSLPYNCPHILPSPEFILPAQEIHLARLWKHCTNKILKQTKVFLPYSDDEWHSPSEFYYLGERNDPNIYAWKF